MSEASKARDAQRRGRPVKFFLACLTPTPDGKSAVTFNSDMSLRELGVMYEAINSYIEAKTQDEMSKADADATTKLLLPQKMESKI